MGYTRFQKILHWLLAVLILLWLFVGGEMVEEADGAEKITAIAIHSGGALLILLLMIVRWFARQKNPVPPADTLKNWEKVWSLRVHLAFYILVVLMVFSGIMQGIFFEQDVKLAGVIPITIGYQETFYGIFHAMHGVIATLLKILILLHVLAALKHQFIDRQAFLQRMF